MTLRTFTDGSGRRWTVFAVVPSGFRGEAMGGAMGGTAGTERRGGAGDRRVSTLPIDFPERRRGPRSRRRPIPTGYERGWLAFHHEDSDDRRRLAPIPDGWESSNDDALEALCTRAQPYKRSGGVR